MQIETHLITFMGKFWVTFLLHTVHVSMQSHIDFAFRGGGLFICYSMHLLYSRLWYSIIIPLFDDDTPGRLYKFQVNQYTLYREEILLREKLFFYYYVKF